MFMLKPASRQAASTASKKRGPLLRANMILRFAGQRLQRNAVAIASGWSGGRAKMICWCISGFGRQPGVVDQQRRDHLRARRPSLYRRGLVQAAHVAQDDADLRVPLAAKARKMST